MWTRPAKKSDGAKSVSFVLGVLSASLIVFFATFSASEALFKGRVAQLEQAGERLTIAPPRLDSAVRQGSVASTTEAKRRTFDVIEANRDDR